MKRVFMCAVGTCGLDGWAITLIPVAKKRGSSAAPRMFLANSGAKAPCTVETWTAAFSNTRPAIRPMTPPPPSGLDQGLSSKRGAAAPAGVACASSASKAATSRSRSDSNQARASCLRASSPTSAAETVVAVGGGEVEVSLMPSTTASNPALRTGSRRPARTRSGKREAREGPTPLKKAAARSKPGPADGRIRI